MHALCQWAQACLTFYVPCEEAVGETLASANACISLCICVSAGGRAVALPHSAQGHVLSRKGLKNQRRGGPVVNLEHWFYINSRLATDSWPFMDSIRSHTQDTHTYRKLHYAYTRHRRFPLMDSPLPWRKHNSKSMTWRAEGGTVKPSRGTHPLRGLPTMSIGSGLVASWLRYISTVGPVSTGSVQSSSLTFFPLLSHYKQ